MSPRHTNPTRARWDDKQRREQRARAPYNFVPLPDKVVKANPPLDQDAYEGYTGWIDCEVETCSPTYVRGMLTEAQYAAHGDTPPDQLTAEQKLERAPFFSTGEELAEGKPKPMIPGSSLRGMLRTLVEIVGHGKIRWVTNEDKVFFRAVAAPVSDPLRQPYEAVLGKYGRNVRAGYLETDGEAWWLRPALTPADLGWPEKQEAYLKVRETLVKHLPGYVEFNDPNYHPQLHEVSFDVATMQGKRGRYTAIQNIGPRSPKGKHKGVVVCSGSMLETGQAGQSSPRQRHALVLDVNTKTKRIKIAEQAAKDYLAGMTPFQRENLQAWGGSKLGCLRQGAPVFYVPSDSEVIYFGHSPNFRIPARQKGSTHATAPYDLIPEALRTTDDRECDLADAIFGWTPETVSQRATSRAGRVFVGDARMVSANDGVWLRPSAMTPHVLGGPKATTFQHYLTQEAGRGHDPDNKASLSHYATPTGETQIRGHKMYWHKGKKPDIEATPKEKEHESQLTRMIPVKVGVKFAFRLRFENLSAEELGALLWVLTLPGESSQTYRHKIGMGKPLGMGSVAITIKNNQLHNRRDRYTQLFGGSGEWHAGADVQSEDFVAVFDKFVTDQINQPARQLRDVDRIQAMLKLMEWRGDDPGPTWLEWTRYMQIEHPDNGNEYKERPVLPDSFGVDETVSGKSQATPRYTGGVTGAESKKKRR
ncbi:MAG: TIGR03986 family CRISPR-associated RAMP protein [Acidobacteria bacterium]|nr:TIGR03986 family CRISPR-associated RAMP protein [Acidobacteriota bacterium]